LIGRLSLTLAGVAALLAVGCRASEEVLPSAVPRGEEPAAGRFRPPANGLLSQEHLDVYVRVRRAAKGRSDADAARAVGADSEEFAWVRARVAESLVALDARRVKAEAAGTYARALASLKEARTKVRDPEAARAVDTEIQLLERERGSLSREEPLSPQVTANAKLVAGRRAEIEAVSAR